MSVRVVLQHADGSDEEAASRQAEWRCSPSSKTEDSMSKIGESRLPISDGELIDAWLTSETSEAIGTRLGISKNTLQDRWHQLKALGQLPRRTRSVHYNNGRGRHKTHAHNRVFTNSLPLINDHLDGRPTVRQEANINAMRARSLEGRDLLLERLVAEHGEPRPDLYPGT
jgi:hypothetical protein